MGTTILKYALSMSAYFMILIFIIEMFRKHYKASNIVWIASLFTFPIWLMGGVVGWFRWAKNLSVIIPTIFVGFVRIANIEKRKGKLWEALQKHWPLYVIYGVLFLNIMEATLKDVALGNYLNALCGLLLCITIPLPHKFWKISDEKPGDLIAYTTIGWNFMYTTWNACFVYGESPMYFASSLCILLAAEIYPILKGRPELYIMARVYTLATHLIIRSCFVWLFPAVMDASSWFNSTVLVYWGLANGILMIGYTAWHFYQVKNGREEDIFYRRKSSVHSKA